MFEFERPPHLPGFELFGDDFGKLLLDSVLLVFRRPTESLGQVAALAIEFDVGPDQLLHFRIVRPHAERILHRCRRAGPELTADSWRHPASVAARATRSI